MTLEELCRLNNHFAIDFQGAVNTRCPSCGDSQKVEQSILVNQTRANAVIVKGHNIQVVYGVQVTKMRRSVDEYLATVN